MVKLSRIFLVFIPQSFPRLKADFQSSHEAPRIRCECLHLIKIDCLALRLDESAHASLAASCEELRARTGNPPLVNFMRTIIYTTVQ